MLLLGCIYGVQSLLCANSAHEEEEILEYLVEAVLLVTQSYRVTVMPR